MTGNKELKCVLHPFGALQPVKFVVICSFFEGRILLSFHSRHKAWETQGGHIEPGETPEEAARRELFEESGVQDAALLPVCDYFAWDNYGSANGRVYAAKVRVLGALPESEMSCVQLFDSLPKELTYPLVTPALIDEAREAIGRGF